MEIPPVRETLQLAGRSSTLPGNVFRPCGIFRGLVGQCDTILGYGPISLNPENRESKKSSAPQSRSHFPKRGKRPPAHRKVQWPCWYVSRSGWAMSPYFGIRPDKLKFWKIGNIYLFGFARNNDNQKPMIYRCANWGLYDVSFYTSYYMQILISLNTETMTIRTIISYIKSHIV